jgi:hypothetical protein
MRPRIIEEHFMKFRIAVASFLLSAGLVGQASAQNNCNQGNSLSGLGTLLSGKTVCAALGTDRWQEYHMPGGDLWDYKRGPGNAVDPSKKVGNWSVTSVPIGNSNNTRETVTYNYGGGNSYTYYVCAAGSSYTFNATNGSTVVTGATLSNGQVACGQFASATAPGKSGR